MEKRTLKKWGIFSYGVGTFGINFSSLIQVYALLFMTDYLGMNAGIVAGLIAVSKVFDGVSDIIAGTIIDRTKNKKGKARVWIIRMIPLMALSGVLCFFIPVSAPEVVKYIYFFISYTLYADVFFTMYSVASQTMPLFATKSSQDRVYLGMANFSGTVVASAVIPSIYLVLIAKFGGGVQGWRMLSIIFAVVFVIAQVIYVSSVKELPHDEKAENKKENVWKDFVKNVRYLLKNRFFIFMFIIMFLYTGSVALFGTVSPFYCIRILGDINNAAGTQTYLGLTASGVIIGLMFTPVLIKKLGIYKSNLSTRILCCIIYIGVIYGGVTHNFKVILIFELLFFICQGPYLGSVGAVMGEVCKYSYLKHGANIEATVASCNSMGTKLGNAFGVALVGWLLSASHYDGLLSVQPESAQNMISAIFIITPIIAQIVIAVLLAFMNVEKENEKLGECKNA